MTENKSSFLGGFDIIADVLKPDNDGKKLPVEDDNIIDVDPQDLQIKDDEPTDVEPVEDDEPIPTPAPADEPVDDLSDLSELEPDIAGFFQERLATELGWEFGEDEKFESVSDAVDYMGKMVEEASKPRYASDEVAEIDEFVRNGGDLKEFYNRVQTGSIDLNKVDLDKVEHQKEVVKTLLKQQGVKDAIIEKRLSRFEDTGILQEEAEEALPLLTEMYEEKKVKLLETQRELKRTQEKQQREFFTSVDKTVKEMKNIRGIAINESEKKEILDYIFKPGSDGLTQYQKEYMSNVKNLIESAYFTKKGDVLLDRAKKQAASDTAIDLKKKISAKKGSRLSGRDNQDSGSNLGFGSLSNMLLKKV
jgi:hypothetical protein